MHYTDAVSLRMFMFFICPEIARWNWGRGSYWIRLGISCNWRAVSAAAATANRIQSTHNSILSPQRLTSDLPPLPVIMARLWSLWFITNRRRPEIEVSLWRLWHWATSCHSNGNDTTHLRRRTDQSIAFTMWRQCALRFNTRRLYVDFSVFFDGCGVASVVGLGFGQIWRPRTGR